MLTFKKLSILIHRLPSFDLVSKSKITLVVLWLVTLASWCVPDYLHENPYRLDVLGKLASTKAGATRHFLIVKTEDGSIHDLEVSSKMFDQSRIGDRPFVLLRPIHMSPSLRDSLLFLMTPFLLFIVSVWLTSQQIATLLFKRPKQSPDAYTDSFLELDSRG